jgi:hypothetical protein
MLPFDDQQDETYYAIKKIEQGLPTLTMPTLLLRVYPGAILNSDERVKWFQERLPKLEAVDVGQGIHFL